MDELKHIEALIKKAGEASTAGEAMQFAQAASIVANAAHLLRELREKK